MADSTPSAPYSPANLPTTSSPASLAIGVDVGGSGIKVGVVDVARGELVAPRLRVVTPVPSTPAKIVTAIARTVTRAVKAAGGVPSGVPVGVGVPCVVIDGVTKTAANIDAAWVEFDAGRALESALKRSVVVLNDADAAGIAEMRFGVGKDRPGVVIFLTLGTGVGSGVFDDGVLVPNTEFGQMEIRGRAAERRSAAAARIRRGLSWKAWAADLDEHLDRIDKLIWPNLIILGGGVSKTPEKFIPRLTVRPRSCRPSSATTRGSSAPRCRRVAAPERPVAFEATLVGLPPGGGIIGPSPTAAPFGTHIGRSTVSPDDAAEPATAPTRDPDGHRRRARRCRRRPDLRRRQPGDRAVIATAPLGGREDVDRAVAAARKAFDDRKGWANWAAGKRGRTLAKLAALVKEHTEELAQLESRNVGKPITGARGEITGASLVFDYYAGAANKIFGQTIPVSKPGLDITLREPIGVVGLIVPWNFPLLMATWKLGPALAAGNTCILKPASYSPLTAIRLGELALEAGFPAGVLNVVTGPGGTAGAAIAAHPGVGKVAFTGETTTGQEIMRLASNNVKKITLELGGKSPNIVFADADLERFAARVAVLGLRQLRPGLLRPQPDPRRALGPRQGRRAVRRGDPEGQGRRPGRRGDRGRDAGQLQAARPRQGLHRDRAGRGRDPRRRRRGARTIRPWPAART